MAILRQFKKILRVHSPPTPAQETLRFNDDEEETPVFKPPTLRARRFHLGLGFRSPVVRRHLGDTENAPTNGIQDHDGTVSTTSPKAPEIVSPPLNGEVDTIGPVSRHAAGRDPPIRCALG